MVMFPHRHLSVDPTYTMAFFYVWTQVALYIPAVVSVTSCSRPFMKEFDLACGAFDETHVAAQTVNDQGSNSNTTTNTRTKGVSQSLSRTALSKTAGEDGDAISLTTKDGHADQAFEMTNRTEGPLIVSYDENTEEKPASMTQDNASIQSNNSQRNLINVTTIIEVQRNQEIKPGRAEDFQTACIGPTPSTR